MNIIEMVVDEANEEGGVFAISLVNEPAIEEDFIALSKQHEIRFKAASEEKRLLIGPALIPNKTVFRKGEGEDVDDYYIYFSSDTIRTASQLFFKRKQQDQTTFEHKMSVEGVTVVESWIIEDSEKDKSAVYGMSYPVGTWMVAMKVDNEEIWNDAVKNGVVKGLSIEGYFTERVKASKQEPELSEDEKTLQAIEELLSKAGL